LDLTTMHISTRFSAAMLAFTMACVTTQAIAQFRPGGASGGGMRGSRGGMGETDRGQRGPGEQRPAVQEDAVSVTEYRLDLLHMDLKLTPDQEPSWKSFADKVSALAADMSRERGRTQSVLQMKSMPRIDHAVDIARNRLTALEDIATAAKAFYGRLTPEQQSLADMRIAPIIPTLGLQATSGIPGTGGGFGPGSTPGPRDRPQSPPQ
jgi:hypothetical protein